MKNKYIARKDAANDPYQHREHNKNLLMVHLIFVTKYRKAILFGKLREDIKQSIYNTCVQHHWYIKRMETDKDHIHILLQYNPTDSIAQIVSALKQYSTYIAYKKHRLALSRCYYRKQHLWSPSYFAASVGQVSQETIEKYIANQG